MSFDGGGNGSGGKRSFSRNNVDEGEPSDNEIRKLLPGWRCIKLSSFLTANSSTAHITMSSSAPYDDMSKEEKSTHDAREREREKEEQAGMPSTITRADLIIDGCLALPYRWTQDLGTVTVMVPLRKGTRGRDCTVVLERKKFKVS